MRVCCAPGPALGLDLLFHQTHASRTGTATRVRERPPHADITIPATCDPLQMRTREGPRDGVSERERESQGGETGDFKVGDAGGLWELEKARTDSFLEAPYI